MALALNRARPSAHEKGKLVVTPDERRQNPRAAAPAAAARPDDAVEHHRRRHALELMRAFVLGDEQPGGLALYGRGDEHRPGLGRPLHARRDVRRIAEHLARRVDHDWPHVEADAGLERRRAGLRVAGVELGERALNGEGGAHGALRVVLLRLRIAEQRHQPVAELFQHMAA